MSVFLAITEWNIGHLALFTELFRSLPLKQVGFMHTNYTIQRIADVHNLQYGNSYAATVSNMEGINLDNMDLEKLFEEISVLRSRKFPFDVTFSPLITSLEGLEQFYRHPEKKIGKICNDAFRTMMIKTDGTVIPAHGRCYNVEAGNLYRQNLVEIWNSDTVKQFRKTLMHAGGLLPACTRCCSAF
jgi:MoaA/NifB/PqqE/SkfB family radical SAM enzyme